MERSGEVLLWQNLVGTGGRKEGEEERLLSTLGFRALSTNKPQVFACFAI